MAKIELLKRIPYPNARSLVWFGDSLFDWASGGDRLELDGTVVKRHVNYAFSFDAACTSPSGEYTVIYTRLGTKGLVLHNGKVLREINRSFYHAAAYEFPVVVGRLSNGREVIVHCPEHYNRLEIDDVATGERLTRCDERKPCDAFHSRLAFSPSGKKFLSAGWIWHPIDFVGVYELDDAIADPHVLDEVGMLPDPGTEISSGAFLDEHQIIVWTSDETLVDEKDFEADPTLIRPNRLTLWGLDVGRAINSVAVSETVGTLMPISAELAVGFYDHPKIFNLATGEIVERFNNVSSGQQVSSIHSSPQPLLAIDAKNRRFAIATGNDIVVAHVV